MTRLILAVAAIVMFVGCSKAEAEPTGGFVKGTRQIGVYEDKEHGVVCYFHASPNWKIGEPDSVALSCVKVAP